MTVVRENYFMLGMPRRAAEKMTVLASTCSITHTHTNTLVPHKVYNR